LAIRNLWLRARARILLLFPEHQIYFRTNGNIRFLTISTRLQVAASSVATALVCWLLVASATYWLKSDAIQRKEQEIVAQQKALAVMQDRVQDLASNVAVLQDDVADSATRIRARQQFLEKLFNNEIKIDRNTAESKSKNEKDGAQQPASLDVSDSAVLDPYRQLEQDQVKFADAAAEAADARYKQMERLLARLGLNARTLIGQSMMSGMGGPLVEASFEKGAFAALEDPFKDLYLSWSRLAALQSAMTSIPATMPARNFVLTSGFGYRRDPFTGAGAMHTGIDFSGIHGTPIYAAADGIVEKAQMMAGYGFAVELDHGRNIGTLYAHLSRISVRNGQRVKAGQIIGLMGSTGRSTGTHLHYEVRLNGSPVNPRPFLEASDDVLEIQKRAIRQSATLRKA
jgi:murein DD-endopeptidase MepM/ murein hydrolase activator NlpD